MRIFLIGFMGSGKSSWGRQWAERYNYKFVDLDEAIEAKEGESVAMIFEKKGETVFRLWETRVLRTMGQNDNCIIACGGGTPCFHDNMDWIKEHGTSCYLEASPAFILERVKDEKDKRPLIRKMNEAELLFFIEKTLKERMPYYSRADHHLQVETLTITSLDGLLANSK